MSAETLRKAAALMREDYGQDWQQEDDGTAFMLAVADWLAETAAEHGEHPPENWGLIDWTYCDGGCRAVRQMSDGHNAIAPAEWPCKPAQQALAVALAYLEEER